MNSELNPLNISRDVVISTEGEQVVEIPLYEGVDSHLRHFEVTTDYTGVKHIKYAKSDAERIEEVREELRGL